jgi:hypothetical protein
MGMMKDILWRFNSGERDNDSLGRVTFGFHEIGAAIDCGSNGRFFIRSGTIRFAYLLIGQDESFHEHTFLIRISIAVA